MEALRSSFVSTAAVTPCLAKTPRMKKLSSTIPMTTPCGTLAPRAAIAGTGAATKSQNGTAKALELSAQEIMDIESKVVVQTYGRTPLVITKGQGSILYDSEGRQFIDMASGIAVNSLGHSDSSWLQAVTQQAAELAHVSNLYYTWPMVSLAKRLVDSSDLDRVFFCNTGTEANEAAIKFSRKFQLTAHNNSPDHPTEFVSFTNCFHGRTMGALALTYKDGYRHPFAPVMPGAEVFAEYGNLESARAHIKAGKTAAVFVEPVQGEGGVHPATKAFLEGLRQLCDEAGALLVFDEVQCGLGRTGLLWAHQAYGVVPDIMTLAKPLAGGLPIGAVLVKEKVASAMSPGDHGSTFAGNPLVCAAAHAVLDRINTPQFLVDVVRKGELLRSSLRSKLGASKHVVEVRGVGLIVGIQLDVPAGPAVEKAREGGVLMITAGKGDVVRLVPPLIITEAEIEQAADVIAQAVLAMD